MVETPSYKIKKSLQHDIPLDLFQYLPKKWEKIGNIGIIKLPEKLKSYKTIIGKTYAEILDCKTILNDIGGIVGVFRKPHVEILFGPHNTETEHTENGVRYQLDVQKIMFSSGNMSERLRMANISDKNETVVDLFAGIGYFTLPIAIYSRPKKIYSIEMNSLAYTYLCKNIILNAVSSIVQPLHGDNRIIAPSNVAERVIMGYLDDTQRFLTTAFRCLKNCYGYIHYHDLCPVEDIPEKSIKIVEKIAQDNNRNLEVLHVQVVKSYAPGINHIVLDIKVVE
jgi:tRNA wybutosine-synthesizing protein 2